MRSVIISLSTSSSRSCSSRVAQPQDVLPQPTAQNREAAWSRGVEENLKTRVRGDGRLKSRLLVRASTTGWEVKSRLLAHVSTMESEEQAVSPCKHHPMGVDEEQGVSVCEQDRMEGDEERVVSACEHHLACCLHGCIKCMKL